MKTFEQRGHENNKADIYNYDALYRLKDITFNADNPTSPTTFDKKKSVNFDKVDNILKLITTIGANSTDITAQVNNLNQYTQFDQWGLSHDLNGNTTQKGTQFFTYDYRNQLVSVSGEGSGVSFKYDVLGRRTSKQLKTQNSTLKR